MKTITRYLLFYCWGIFLCIGVSAQIPLVYNVENTGSGFPVPPLPALGSLPKIVPLPDPFAWASDPLGGSRSASFSNWSHRRAEIKAQIEHYEIGTKPAVDTSQIKASYANGTLTVTVTVNSQILTLTSAVVIPSGNGPFPAIIGMNSATGSLPASYFTSRNIAQITFSHNQVTVYNNPQNTDPFFRLYPTQNIDNTGQYAAWSWGISRLIDGLYKLNGILGEDTIDLNYLAVTGCSYAGKMALFSGALDERIALTIAQESGGGGAPSWRYSATQSGVEGLAQTSNQWFKNSMFDFGGANVSYLPVDHHMLMSMCAPRALYVTGNTDYTWLSNKSCYVSCRAAQQIYDTLGIGDRFGFSIDGGHGHCSYPASLESDLSYFLDKFMKGQKTLSRKVATYPSGYNLINYEKWYQWWGTGTPVLPVDTNAVNIWLESECATVGSNWSILTDTEASNGKYVVVNGLNSTGSAPTGSNAVVVFPFTIDSAGTYSIFARINCATANDDSYYVKLDNGTFTMLNGLVTTGWNWVSFANADLTKGPHTFTVAYREDGAKLDKILITTSVTAPDYPGMLGNNCTPTRITNTFNRFDNIIFPNPVNGVLNLTLSGYPSEISLYNSNGQHLLNLKTDKTLEYIDMTYYLKGIYFLKIKTSNLNVIEKIIKL